MPMSARELAKRARVRAKTDGDCAYCGVWLPQDHFRWRMNPADPAFGDAEANLVPACVSCHRRKIGKDAEQFKAHVKELSRRHIFACEREWNLRRANGSHTPQVLLQALSNAFRIIDSAEIEFTYSDVVNAAMRLES